MKSLLLAAAVLVLAGCSIAPTPDPTPTLRAPECFDPATVDNRHCPSWAHDVPADKKVSHFSTEGDAVYMHYEDGTKERVK